jgi:hypothetical protein
VGPGAGGRRGTPRAAWEAPGAEEGEQMRSAAGGCRAEFRNLNTPVIILIFLSSKIKRNQPSFSTFRESDPLLSSSSSSGKKCIFLLLSSQSKSSLVYVMVMQQAQ